MANDFTIRYSSDSYSETIAGCKTLLATKQKATRLQISGFNITVLNGGVIWATRNAWESNGNYGLMDWHEVGVTHQGLKLRNNQKK
jgi:hypothetical protein